MDFIAGMIKVMECNNTLSLVLLTVIFNSVWGRRGLVRGGGLTARGRCQAPGIF